MLDTDICSYVIREDHKNVIDNLIARQNDDICISAITRAEMLYGAKKKNSDRITSKILDFLKIVETVSFDDHAAEVYSAIKNELEKNGTPIGNMDMLIASCAIANDSVLVTNNEKHFSKIKGLKTQNWTG
jgi:tRNA(fMet)-specific endonuclease VapC